MDKNNITQRNEDLIIREDVTVQTSATDIPDDISYNTNENAAIRIEYDYQNIEDETGVEETNYCKDSKNIKDTSWTITSNVTVLSSDTFNSGDVFYNAEEDDATSMHEDNSNYSKFLDKSVDKAASSCKVSTFFNENEIKVAHNNDSATKIKINKKDSAPSMAIRESGTKFVKNSKQNQTPQYFRTRTRNDCGSTKKKMNNVESQYININFIHNDISTNRSFIDWFCIKLSYGLIRQKIGQKSQADPGETGSEKDIDNECNLERQYIKNLKSTTNQRNFARFKEIMKDTVHCSRFKVTKNRDNHNPLRRTYQVYFGAASTVALGPVYGTTAFIFILFGHSFAASLLLEGMTTGGIEYDPDDCNSIVPIVLILVFIMLCLSCGFNIWWIDTLTLEEWYLKTHDPAVCFAFGLILTVMLDLLFAYVPIARHPIFTWTALIAQLIAVHFITFYIGAIIRIPLSDNVALTIAIPGFITALVVLHFLCMAVLKSSLTEGKTPYLVAIGAAVTILFVVTVFAFATLVFQMTELVACWINTLYYVISMLILLQMILTQRVYEMYKFDVALPALLLFTSPYSLITNGIRYLIFYREY